MEMIIFQIILFDRIGIVLFALISELCVMLI
jgi:hypothetical protein